MDQKRIGFFIAACRKEQGITQAQLAEKLGVTDKAVSKWETGRCLPDTSLFIPLTNILGTTIAEFLEGQHIQPIAGPEEKRAARSLKKIYRFFTSHPLLFLLLADTVAEGWLFFRCYRQSGPHFLWIALPLRLLFLMGGYFLARPLPGKRRGNRKAHLFLGGGMAALFLLELYAIKWTAANSGFVLRNILFTTIVCLSIAGAILSVTKASQYDFILLNHLLSIPSALYAFLYDQAFFPLQAGKEYLILASGLFAYGASTFASFVICRCLKKSDIAG